MQVTYRPIGHDWPGQRTPKNERQNSRFYRAGKYIEGTGYQGGGKTPWTATLNLLDHELRELEAESVVFQLDLRESEIRLDGLPRADARPTDPAVIISFDSRQGPLRFYCDRFYDWQDNVRAIALGLEALRKIERYGITHKDEQYAGWKQLPPGTGAISNVIYQLGGPKEAAKFMLEKAEMVGDGLNGKRIDMVLGDKAYRDHVFRQATLKVHPDKGGNRADWDTLGEARRIIETEVNR